MTSSVLPKARLVHSLGVTQSASLTPVLSVTQPWTAAKGRTSNKTPPEQPVCNWTKDMFHCCRTLDLHLMTWIIVSSSHRRLRAKSNSKNKRLQNGPQTLIVGDSAARDVKSMFSVKSPKHSQGHGPWLGRKNPAYRGSTPNCEELHTAHQMMLLSNSLKCWNMTLLICWTQSAFWMLKSLSVTLYHQSEDELRDSAGCWNGTHCFQLHVHSVHFIDNFSFFWDCRHLFGYGLFLTKSGVKLLTSTLLYYLHHLSVPSAKDTRQEESKQVEDITQRGRDLPQPHLRRALTMGDYRAETRNHNPPLPASPTLTLLRILLFTAPYPINTTILSIHPLPPLTLLPHWSSLTRWRSWLMLDQIYPPSPIIYP